MHLILLFTARNRRGTLTLAECLYGLRFEMRNERRVLSWMEADMAMLMVMPMDVDMYIPHGDLAEC